MSTPHPSHKTGETREERPAWVDPTAHQVRHLRTKEGPTVEATTAPRFAVDDTVQYDSRTVGVGAGTVVNVLPADEPDGETEYLVREVPDEPNYERVKESELKPDTTGVLDLDSLPQVLKELFACVTDKSEYIGINAIRRADRIAALGRISLLAARAIWLEASADSHEQTLAEMREG